MKKLLLASLVLTFGVVLIGCDGDESLSAQLFAINNLEDRIDFALENDIAVRAGGHNLEPMYIGEELPKAMFLAFLEEPLDGEEMVVIDETTSEDSEGNMTFIITLEIREVGVASANPAASAVSSDEAAFQAEIDDLSNMSEFIEWMVGHELTIFDYYYDRDGILIGAGRDLDDNDLRAVVGAGLLDVQISSFHSTSATVGAHVNLSVDDLGASGSDAQSGVASGDLTFGSTFTHRDFEITIGSEDDIIWRTVQSGWSDLYGEYVVGIPVHVTNLSGETGRVNTFSYSFFGSAGTRLDSVDTLFRDYDIWAQGDMRDGASQEGFFMILYDGDGDYFIEFSMPDLEVVLPITRY